jgi:putative SOS response-associated peptidase YedK
VCGRYSLATVDPGALRARFALGDSVEVRCRFNVAPGDRVLAVIADPRGAPRGELLRWGLVPSWGGSSRGGSGSINARAETAAVRPAFRDAFARRRCLIVADGFYEWRRGPGASAEAFWITRADHEPFAFAGLWSRRRDPAGRQPPLASCAILTTAANAAIAPLHERMPVILDPAAERAWLDPETPRACLAALLCGLQAERTALTAVGPAVNDARYDGPECLVPAPAPQPTLF